MFSPLYMCISLFLKILFKLSLSLFIITSILIIDNIRYTFIILPDIRFHDILCDCVKIDYHKIWFYFKIFLAEIGHIYRYSLGYLLYR